MNYYISDTHLGHANVIRFQNRPFKDVEEMDKTIIDNWNSVVTDEDDVWILGDLIYKAKDPIVYLKQLKGKKHLIVGNHDKFARNNVFRKYFVSIDDYKEVVDDNTRIIMFHYPIAEWNGYFRNSVHLFGHIHNSKNEAYDTMKQRKNCYNVGADCLGFFPRTLKQIIDMNQ